LPEDVSTYGPEIDRLFYLIYYVTGATFFAVQITLLVFLVLYRHRTDGARRTRTATRRSRSRGRSRRRSCS
jgi:hypothetical protein